MKIVWLCNVIYPRLAEALNEPVVYTGGWLEGLSAELLKEESVDLFYLFPSTKTIDKSFDNLHCIGRKSFSSSVFKEILSAVKPDIIHIFGTEMSHSYQMVCAAKELGVDNRVVVSLQGMLSFYQKHYYANIPFFRRFCFSFSDFVKNNSIFCQQRKFRKRGKTEACLIQNIHNVIGRTEWDYACSKQLNSNIQYYKCNETLRPLFYSNSGKWNYDSCEKHTIFVSQCGYPIKGLHLFLKEFRTVLSVYPDAKLYTTGINPLKVSWIKLQRYSYYHHYIGKLIKKYKLQDNIVFLGNLSEKEMCERYLKSNVYLCCSSIENSPNSLGEAMILGLPCVSSDVGGVKDMLLDKDEGFIYPFDETYMASHYIIKLFNNPDLAKSLSRHASDHANVTHDRTTNNNRLMGIYDIISKKDHND